MQDGERISPTVRLRKLARGLRRWRNDARLSLDELAPRLGWSKSKLGRFEKGDAPPVPADVIAVATVLGIPDDERDRYVTLAFQARQKGWWQRYRKETHKENFDEYVGLESEASYVREVAYQVIPGLLQTSRYAKEILRASPDTSDVADRAGLRTQRQARLHEADPLMLSTVIHEAALRTLVGGPEVMREQLTTLIELAKLDHVSVQILPFSAGAYPAMEAPFIILSFPEPEDPDVPFAEYLTGCICIEDPEDIASYNLHYGALEERALSPAKSLEFIGKVAGEL